MRVINNRGEDTDLLINTYYPYIKRVSEEIQIDTIRFEKDCIHLIVGEDTVIDELFYFLEWR